MSAAIGCESWRVGLRICARVIHAIPIEARRAVTVICSCVKEDLERHGKGHLKHRFEQIGKYFEHCYARISKYRTLLI